MDTMTQQNAALVEETASASEEMSGQAQELLSMVQKFNVGDAAASIIEYENRGSSGRSVVKIDSGNGRGAVNRTVPLNDAVKKSIMEDGGYEEF
jgi:hypothetical protein